MPEVTKEFLDDVKAFVEASQDTIKELSGRLASMEKTAAEKPQSALDAERLSLVFDNLVAAGVLHASEKEASVKAAISRPDVLLDALDKLASMERERRSQVEAVGTPVSAPEAAANDAEAFWRQRMDHLHTMIPLES